MRLYTNGCNIKSRNDLNMAFSPLQSSITGAAPSATISDTKGSQFSTNYPSLFAPLKTKAAGYLSLVLVLGYVVGQFQPFGLRYLLLRLFQLFPVLSRIKLSIKSTLAAVIVGLLINQEIQLDLNLITDFRFLTNGFWSRVDNIVLHYLQNKSTKISAVRLHLFHGFGANGLSFQPIMKLFGINKVNAVAHDTPGFGYSPRFREVSEDTSFPGIYRPLWNARASLTIGDESFSENENGNKKGNGKIDGKSGGADDDLNGIKSNDIILMGHSMGCISAMAAAASVLYNENYLNNNNSRVDTNKHSTNVTLVLIDPAFALSKDEQNITITSIVHTVNQSTENMIFSDKSTEELFLPFSLANLEKVANGVRESHLEFSSNKNSIQSLVKSDAIIPKKIKSICSQFVRFFENIIKIPLKIILRRFVHFDGFWYKGLQYSWGDKKVDEEIVFRYKLAGMAKGFDDDLFSFVAAQQLSGKKKNELVYTNSEDSNEDKNENNNNDIHNNDNDIDIEEGKDKEYVVTNKMKNEGKNKEKQNKQVSSAQDKKLKNGVSGGTFTSSTIVSNVTQCELLIALADLGCKILIFHGMKDAIVPFQLSENMVHLVNKKLSENVSTDTSSRSVVLVPVPGAGHVPHEEDPMTFLKDLKNNGINLL